MKRFSEPHPSAIRGRRCTYYPRTHNELFTSQGCSYGGVEIEIGLWVTEKPIYKVFFLIYILWIYMELNFPKYEDDIFKVWAVWYIYNLSGPTQNTLLLTNPGHLFGSELWLVSHNTNHCIAYLLFMHFSPSSYYMKNKYVIW